MKTLLIILTLVLCGCAKTATITHPGAGNQFDSNTYDSLVSVEGAIDAARSLAVTQPQKDILNKVIAAYQEAKAAYVLYHTTVVAGGTADTATLSAQIAALVAATAGLVTQIKGAQ